MPGAEEAERKGRVPREQAREASGRLKSAGGGKGGGLPLPFVEDRQPVARQVAGFSRLKPVPPDSPFRCLGLRSLPSPLE